MTLEPLHVRPGARYACYADGLCCSDIHAIGPVTEKERAMLSVIDPNVVRRNRLLDEWVMTMSPDEGQCLLLQDGKCAIHETMGGLLKPNGCHRFPFGLTLTPRGGRITMEVRCSCQTLMAADAPGVDAQSVAPLLLDEDGAPDPAFILSEDVAMSAGHTIPFDAYAEAEREILEAIASVGLEAALDRAPFEGFDADWIKVAHGMQEQDTATRFHTSLLYVADAILDAQGQPDAPERPRAWTPAYERAQARMPAPIEPEAIYACWASESIWRMHWAARISFEQHRKSLATLLDIARRIAVRLEREGLRPDRAAAEAVTIVETIGTSIWWYCIDEKFSDE